MIYTLALVATGSLACSSLYMVRAARRCTTADDVYVCLGVAFGLGLGAAWVADTLL